VDFLLLCSIPVRAAEETWVKVQSPHFLVLSNGSQDRARDVALGFEQIRAVFAAVLPNLTADSSAEDTVFAVKDERTFTSLIPLERKQAERRRERQMNLVTAGATPGANPAE
jgi:hypothetical protein